LGRHRKPVGELTRSVCINLKQKVLDRINLEGTPKQVIERLVNEKFAEKNDNEIIDKC
jgi:hypothetical protein